MRTPVVAIGPDAADPVLLERYMDAGHLPALSRLRAGGAYARLTTFDFCRAEASNTTFLTGCSPATHGYWSPFRFHPDYRVETTPYEFADYQPFYGLGPDYRVAVFAMPQSKLSPRVNGIQVLGWGAHHPAWPGMKAFALPSFSEGYVRLNVRGREARGVVDDSGYDAACDEITSEILRLSDARTGGPLDATRISATRH